jgi:hypothetical protein
MSEIPKSIIGCMIPQDATIGVTHKVFRCQLSNLIWNQPHQIDVHLWHLAVVRHRSGKRPFSGAKQPSTVTVLPMPFDEYTA